MFSFNNITPGMLKILLFLSILIFGFIYLSDGEPKLYYYGIGGIVIFIFLIGNTPNKEYIEFRNEHEARKIANDYIKNKIMMKNSDFDIILPDGELEYDGFSRHDEREGFNIPFFEFGFHINPTYQSFPENYSIEIYGMKVNLDVMNLNKLKEPYFGERYRIKYVLTDVSDKSKYNSASLMVYNHNKAEGFEN